MWRTVQIGHREAEVFLPENPIPQAAVIYLHAHGEERLSEKAEITRIFESASIPVICPRGGQAWWLDIPCEEFDSKTTPMEYVRNDVVGWIDQHCDVRPPHLALLGISMGGQGALNLAYRHGRTFPVVAAISSAIELHKAYGYGFRIDQLFENAEAARQQSALLHIHPLNWPKYQFIACDPMDPTWFEGNEILTSKLSSSGIPFECDLKTSLGGHTWDYFTVMTERAMEFIGRSLRRLTLKDRPF